MRSVYELKLDYRDNQVKSKITSLGSTRINVGKPIDCHWEAHGDMLDYCEIQNNLIGKPMDYVWNHADT
jgi:hypothetical protein